MERLARSKSGPMFFDRMPTGKLIYGGAGKMGMRGRQRQWLLEKWWQMVRHLCCQS